MADCDIIARMAEMESTSYRAFWLRREKATPTPETVRAREAACFEARRLGEILGTEFCVRRVFLFGSFAWGVETRLESALDLAVEGLASGMLVPAHARLSRASDYSIDLVALERLPDVLRRRIELSGILVYDPPPISFSTTLPDPRR